MTRYLLFFLLIYVTKATYSQQVLPNKVYKPVIDSLAIKNWVRLYNNDMVYITNDGKYFMYYYATLARNDKILVIQSTDNSWKVEFSGADNNLFFDDNKSVSFMIKDTLCFLSLGTNDIKKITDVKSYKYPKERNTGWLVYHVNNKNNDLILQNILTGKEYKYNFIKDYAINNAGNALVLKCIAQEADHSDITLKWVDLPEGVVTNIWEGKRNDTVSQDISNYVFDATGTQLAFIVQEKPESSAKDISKASVWHYRAGMKSAAIKASNSSAGLEPGLFINNSKPKFSKDGQYIFFQLQRPPLKTPQQNIVKVDVWNYLDTVLQCTQLQQTGLKIYEAAIDINDNRVMQLTHDYETIKAFPEKGHAVVISYNSKGDRFWLRQQDTNYLFSLKDGKRKLLSTFGLNVFAFSPTGRYLVYYDSKKEHNYFSYDLQTGKVVNLSKNICNGCLGFKDEYSDGKPEKRARIPIGIAGWLENDEGLLVYDLYDIWCVDLTGDSHASNITNGYGRQHQIKFRLTHGMKNFSDPVVFTKDASLLITAFNCKNKYNGFFTKQLNKKGDPVKLLMSAATFCLIGSYLLPINDQSFDPGMTPVKARDTPVWIVNRQTATEAPNYFLTSDFKAYKPLTTWQPQKAYNWLTAELVTWKQADGTLSKGILYKPENFNPAKKYPVIFNYYQQRSHRMYQFPTPDYFEDNINVPWFVSREYLVFTPDIYYRNNDAGKSALYAVVSSAIWLKNLPYVDGTRMGVNGHSFGGSETNYIITHTGLFSAAIECAGVSNTVSSALQLGGEFGHYSRLQLTEVNKGDVSIWDNPHIYIEGSPVIKANNVKTPLLIMHNKKDGAVPWAQGVEMFIALRRLGKPVWMLQYDESGHSVWGRDAVDFTIRATQFFDHYLKGRPAPKWMIKGIPARLKGVETGYESDGGEE
jgi:dienelactone hydrolase